jgi:hypothetical protein
MTTQQTASEGKKTDKKSGKVTQAATASATKAQPSINTYVISAAELPKDISFEYNARSPSRASRAYKSMRETLANQPERFIELNGGISLAGGKYVLDGGHTVTAIQDAIREDGVDPKRVHIAVRDYGELSHSEMGLRSAALNRRVTPPLMGEKDLEGVWDPIKNALDKKYLGLYEFRPNTRPDAPYNVSFLVALLHAWTETQAERCYSGKGQLVRLFSAAKYSRVLPHLNMAIEFYGDVYKALLSDKKIAKLDCVKPDSEVTLPSGEKITGFIPESLVWPTFAAFSALLDSKGNWAHDPRDELQKKLPKLVKQLLADYKEAGNNPGVYGKTPTNYLSAVIALRSA